MKRYEKYKPSGVEWIGEIPEHWKVKRLKYGTLINKSTLPEKFLEDYSIKYIDISSVNGNGNILGYAELLFSEAPSRARRIVKKGDTIVSTVRTYLKAIAYIPFEEKNLICSTGFAVISPLQHLLYPKFLFYLCRSENFIDVISALSKGVSYPAIDSENLKSIAIWIPEIQEQIAIANFLDEKTTQIDALIAKKQKLIELLKEERTAIINQAVTKGINPKAKLNPSGIEWLGDIPEHWEVKKLKHLIKEERGAIKTGPFGSQMKNSDFVVEGPFKVYNQRNVLDNDFDKGEDFIEAAKFEELKDFEVFEGDVLFTTRGTIGKCAIFPANKQRGVLHPCLMRVQFDESKVNKEWIKLFANQSSFFLENVMLLSNSTTIEVIYSYSLKEVCIPLPETIKEQNEIIGQIVIETQQLDATIAKIGKEIELMQEYRSALISEVVTGKIKVT